MCHSAVLLDQEGWLNDSASLPLGYGGQNSKTHEERSSTAWLLHQLNTADLTNRDLSSILLKNCTLVKDIYY